MVSHSDSERNQSAVRFGDCDDDCDAFTRYSDSSRRQGNRVIGDSAAVVKRRGCNGCCSGKTLTRMVYEVSGRMRIQTVDAQQSPDTRSECSKTAGYAVIDCLSLGQLASKYK